MKEKFRRVWKSSTKRSKQRKYRAQAPLHIRSTLLCAHLSKELRGRIGTRSLRVRKGDTVLVMRGNYRKKSGIVATVNTGNETIFIEGIDVIRKNGTKSFVPIRISNVMITKLIESDPRRFAVKTSAGSSGQVAKKVDKASSVQKSGEKKSRPKTGTENAAVA